MSNIKNYKQFLEALHAGSLPLYTFTGVNYGSSSDTVADHFGAKNGKPSSQKSNIDGFVMGEDGENFYSEDDIKEILLKYDVWTKQNNEEPIDLTKVDGKVIDYIVNLIGWNNH